MNSMTGYGYKEAVIDNTQICIEIRSVNSRFLELSINMPTYLNQLEQRIRQIVCEKVYRGKIDLFIRIKDNAPKTVVSVNPNAALMYKDAMVQLAKALGKPEDDIPLSLIMAQEGVLSVSHEYDAESYWVKIQPLLATVIDIFIEDRAREGENLKRDLLSKLDSLDSCAAFFKEWQPKMEQKFKENITQKFTELLGEHVDENRIMQETAALIVKYTINEEIIRLHSHLEALRKEILDSPAPGKKIDFICQEANREINTIGSKNQFIEVGSTVIVAKDALENIREQCKNVE